MGKSDPYLEFCRQMPDGKFVAVHRTEVFAPFLTQIVYSCLNYFTVKCVFVLHAQCVHIPYFFY